MALTRPKYSQIYDTDWKQSVEIASTADVGNLILGNSQPNSIDGVTVLTNWRVLVKDQTNGAQNGIYVVRNAGTGSNGWWTRSLDAAQSNFVTAGLTVAVISGSVNGGKEFRLTTPDPITLGTTVLTFIDPNAAAGAGGANTQVQFNDLSTLAGSPGFTFNKGSNILTVSNNISTSTLTASGNVSVSNNISTSTLIATGNVSGLYILGNGSQLTGITTDATSIQSGTSSVKTYSSSNIAISVAGSANTVVFTSSNIFVAGSILPTANITYDLGSPTNKFRSAYFSGNTIYIGPESISVSDNGTWTFTSNGGNTTMSSSSAMANISMDKATGFMGFNDTSPDFVYDFTAPTDGGELLHIETLVGTQAFFGAQNQGGLRYMAGVDQNYVFSGSKSRPDHYVLMTAGMVRANIHGNTGNVIFSNSISVTQDVSTAYLGTQEFRATGANITVRSDVTLLGTKLFGAGQLAIGTEDVGAERLFVTGGETYLDGDVTITGNLFVNGNTTTFNANNLTISDSMIFLADNNPGDTLDIGFISSFTSAVRYQHTGFIRDASDGTWKLFANVVPEPTTTVDFTDANYGNILVGNIQATYFTGNGAFLTGLPAGYSNVNAATFFASGTLNTAVNTTANILANGAIVTSITVNGVGTFTNPASAASTVKTIIGKNGAFETAILPRAGGGSYNPLTTVDDSMIFFGGGNGQGSGNLVITNWNVNRTGIRIVGNTGLVEIPGQLTINANNSPTAIANGGTNGVGNIGASGAEFNTVFAKSTSAQYADLAEIYTSDQQYPAGTVVVFGGSAEVMQSHSSHDTRIAGVVSTNPAYLMNSTETGVPVALQGRVPCRVLGPVSQGDRVVSSHIAGVAQALDPLLYQPGCIIGKALQAIDSQDIQTIEVVVGRV